MTSCGKVEKSLKNLKLDLVTVGRVFKYISLKLNEMIMTLKTFVSILSVLCVAILPCLASLQPLDYRLSGTFDEEIDPGNPGNIRALGGAVGYINDGTWVAYNNFNFGTGATHAYIEAASANSGGTITLRTGTSTGPVIGSVNIPNTGGFSNFRVFDFPLTQPISGNHKLYLTFSGGGGYLFDTRAFWFPQVGPNLKQAGSAFNATGFDDESHPGTSPVVANNGVVDSIEGGSWVGYTGFNFGTDSNRIEIEASAAGKGGRIELRMGSENGSVIGGLEIAHTGSWTHHRIFSVELSQKVSGIHDLYLRFMDSNSSAAELFRLKRFSVFRVAPLPLAASQERLNVYPPVSGLDPSPYYTFSVQKVSALNASKQNATNWLQPFAWFTKCVDYPADPQTSSAYYAGFFGSWSHTYCNFELDPRTPIVVKITRLIKAGAPSGPITTAVARPAHKVISTEVINGDVYVTMRESGQVAVDIDGQMDSRDTPRAIVTGSGVWGSQGFPHRSELLGAHGVTIFANPVIENKPDPMGPGVFAVEPGTLPPTDGTWTTLYFKPGIHKLSVDTNGDERGWQVTDPLPLRNGKSYYIPGDAIVYGNMSDYQDNLASTDIRVFGHGTLSGAKIPHFQDFPPGTTPTANIPPVGSPEREGYMTDDGAFLPRELNEKLQMLSLSKADNCHFEGITIANPPEHGFRMYHEGDRGNSLRWLKNISWRVNNDGASVNGKGVVEDCFFRHQDDALYIDGTNIRRCVFWSDVNGLPLRCSFIVRDRDASYPVYEPADLIVEDCDIIYARGVFSTGDGNSDFGVISTNNAASSRIYSDGTPNTAQHLIFRNIRITDPRPQRFFIGFEDPGTQPQFRGWAGIRFENIDFRFPNTWGWKNRLLSSATAPARFWNFGNVTIAGQLLDATLFADPLHFQTSNTSDMIFKGPSFQGPSFTLTTPPPANGYISSDPVGSSFLIDTSVQMTAIPAPGYVFSSWGGALAGSTDNPSTLVMDSNKTVTAIFTLLNPPLKNVLLVVGDPTIPNASDTAIHDRLTSLNYGVQIVDDTAVLSADATGKDLVIVSSTATSGAVNTKLRDIPVPVINWESALQDDFRFTSSLPTDSGTQTNQAALNIVQASHPLAAGLPAGNLTVTSSSIGFSWGLPVGNPLIIARLTDGTNHPCLYAYEFGAAMNVGTAAARRVHLFLQNDTFNLLNADGLKLFDAALTWAMSPPPSNTYASWATSHASDQAPEADFDDDGIPNGVEYFMGQTGSSFTPNPSVIDGKVIWPKDPNALATHLVQTSVDMIDWVPAVAGVIDTGTSVEFTLPVGDPARFTRLKVTVISVPVNP